MTACTRAAFRTGRAVPGVRRGREAFEVLIANGKKRKREEKKEERRERKIRKKVKRFGKEGTKKLGFPRIREDTRVERFLLLNPL